MRRINHSSRFIEMFGNPVDSQEMGTLCVGDLCSVISGFPFKSELFNDNKVGKPLIRIRDVVRGYTETYTTEESDSQFIVKTGDLLVGMDGNFEISVWKSEEALLNQRVCMIAPKDERITRNYIIYAVQPALTAIEEKTNATTVKHISASQISSIRLPRVEEVRVAEFDNVVHQADKSKFSVFKSRFIEMQKTSDCQNELGDFIERCIPERCGDRELPVLSVTKEYAMVHQSERFEATIVSRDKSNYIVAPRGYLVQGIHIDESNFGIQNLVDEGIVSPAYKLWRFKNQDSIPELIEYYLRSEMAIKYFKRHFLGSTVPRRQVIKKDDFLSMPINLPGKSIQESYFAFFKQADKSKYLN